MNTEYIWAHLRFSIQFGYRCYNDISWGVLSAHNLPGTPPLLSTWDAPVVAPSTLGMHYKRWSLVKEHPPITRSSREKYYITTRSLYVTTNKEHNRPRSALSYIRPGPALWARLQERLIHSILRCPTRSHDRLWVAQGVECAVWKSGFMWIKTLLNIYSWHRRGYMYFTKRSWEVQSPSHTMVSLETAISHNTYCSYFMVYLKHTSPFLSSEYCIWRNSD